MNRTFASTLALAGLALSLTGCFGGDSDDSESDPIVVTSEEATSATDGPTEAPEATADGDESGAQDQTASEACDLIEAEDISDVLGKDFSAAEYTESGDINSSFTCDWTLTDDAGVTTVMLSVYVDTSNSWDLQVEIFKGFDENAAEITVAGAEHALRYDLMGTTNVVIGNGSSYVQVTYMAFATDAAPAEAALELAEIVAGNM